PQGVHDVLVGAVLLGPAYELLPGDGVVQALEVLLQLDRVDGHVIAIPGDTRRHATASRLSAFGGRASCRRARICPAFDDADHVQLIVVLVRVIARAGTDARREVR